MPIRRYIGRERANVTITTPLIYQPSSSPTTGKLRQILYHSLENHFFPKIVPPSKEGDSLHTKLQAFLHLSIFFNSNNGFPFLDSAVQGIEFAISTFFADVVKYLEDLTLRNYYSTVNPLYLFSF